jgi:hypothetical protein
MPCYWSGLWGNSSFNDFICCYLGEKYRQLFFMQRMQ